MEAPGSAAGRIWPWLTLASALFAFRSLWRDALVPPSAYAVEVGLFRPAPLPALLVLGVAGWLVWRRRARLLAAPPRRDWLGAALWLAIAAACFAWALLTQVETLLFPSAAASLLAFGATARGRAGVRVLLFPALVLLLGLRIPIPLEDELVWQLQRWAASGAARLLDAIGRDVALAGVILRAGEHEFHVIDGCSGLRGISILLIVALIVRELFARSGARQWLLILVAPVLGHALNVARIAFVAASGHPENLAGFAADHTPQGLAVLAAGTAGLYALGWALAAGGGRPAGAVQSSSAPIPWRLAAGGLAALGVLSLALPPFDAARARAEAAVAFPAAGSGWSSQAQSPDTAFLGVLHPWQAVHRRYQKTGRDGRVRIVELLVARETSEPPRTSHLFSSKLAWPGSRWSLKQRRRAPLPRLDREALLVHAIYGPGPEHAVGYVWRVREWGSQIGDRVDRSHRGRGSDGHRERATRLPGHPHLAAIRAPRAAAPTGIRPARSRSARTRPPCSRYHSGRSRSPPARTAPRRPPA